MKNPEFEASKIKILIMRNFVDTLFNRFAFWKLLGMILFQVVVLLQNLWKSGFFQSWPGLTSLGNEDSQKPSCTYKFEKTTSLQQ